MREEITYVANDGTKFKSKEDCMAHDIKLEEQNTFKKEKIELSESISKKYESLLADIKKYEGKYGEPVVLNSEIFCVFS